MAENKSHLTIPDTESETDVAALQDELDDKSGILRTNVNSGNGEAKSALASTVSLRSKPKK